MAKTNKGMGKTDPRQQVFLRHYLTPNTPYFNNALQSALKAGYSQEYAENILQKDLKWLNDGVLELVGKDTDKKNLVRKAKLVLLRSLESSDERLAQDTAKFIAKTDIEFSDKQETTLRLVSPILGGSSKEKKKSLLEGDS